MVDEVKLSPEQRLSDKIKDIPKDIPLTRIQEMKYLADKIDVIAEIPEEYNEKYHYTLEAQWGFTRPGDGQFHDAYSVCVSIQGNIYVSDSANYRIQKFDGNGNFITKWGSRGTGDGQFPISDPPWESIF